MRLAGFRSRLIELAVPLEADQDGAHLVALGEHKLFDRAGVELGEQSR